MDNRTLVESQWMTDIMEIAHDVLLRASSATGEDRVCGPYRCSDLHGGNKWRKPHGPRPDRSWMQIEGCRKCILIGDGLEWKINCSRGWIAARDWWKAMDHVQKKISGHWGILAGHGWQAMDCNWIWIMTGYGWMTRGEQQERDLNSWITWGGRQSLSFAIWS